MLIPGGVPMGVIPGDTPKLLIMWTLNYKVRLYILFLKEKIKGCLLVTEKLTKRLAWAEQKVSSYNPLVNGPDPLLNDHHKTHLFK
jgi:hypothetical protein